jgi:hypothetical protein
MTISTRTKSNKPIFSFERAYTAIRKSFDLLSSGNIDAAEFKKWLESGETNAKLSGKELDVVFKYLVRLGFR